MRVFHNSLNVAGTGPALRKKTARVTVGRGPVPRHRPCNPTFAGDRPRTTGQRDCSSGAPDPERIKIGRSCPTEEGPTFYRRARACPSPCSDCGGQAPALRCERQFSQRSRRKPARMRVWHPRAPALREENGPGYRRAWACPSPSSASSNDCGGQAPALREI